MNSRSEKVIYDVLSGLSCQFGPWAVNSRSEKKNIRRVFWPRHKFGYLGICVVTALIAGDSFRKSVNNFVKK